MGPGERCRECAKGKKKTTKFLKNRHIFKALTARTAWRPAESAMWEFSIFWTSKILRPLPGCENPRNFQKFSKNFWKFQKFKLGLSTPLVGARSPAECRIVWCPTGHHRNPSQSQPRPPDNFSVKFKNVFQFPKFPRPPPLKKFACRAPSDIIRL